MTTTRQRWMAIAIAAALWLPLGCGGKSTTGTSEEDGGIATDVTTSPDVLADTGPEDIPDLSDGSPPPDVDASSPQDGGPEEVEDAEVVTPEEVVDGDTAQGDAVDASVEDAGDVPSLEDVSDAAAPEDASDATPAGDGVDEETTEPPPGTCLVDADCVPSDECIVATCNQVTSTCAESPAEDGASCEDGNACSIGDQCLEGDCIGQFPLLCDDDNICTDDFCNAVTGCQYKPNFAGCDDSNPCTHDDSCQAGVCFGAVTTCDDDNSCTEDHCEAETGNCVNEPSDELTCSDGSECTAGDACVDGACVPGAEDGCEDNQPCTEDLCQAGVCSNNLAIGTPCTDGDACTAPDLCQLEGCVPGPVTSCDDDNPCTLDTCDVVVGCKHANQEGEPCEDGDACTVDELCSAEAVCGSGQALVCDDENLCTDDDCDVSSGCSYVDNALACDDGDACTGEDVCGGGQCVGVEIDCDDEDACTLDSCDSITGCEAVDTSANCDDENPCTDDACDTVEGCVNTPNSAPCDDGDLCTTDDVCQESACAGVTDSCDDDFPCTWDLCDYEEGCVNELIQGPCDDGDPCTENEACEEDAQCDGGEAVDVDDGVDCTLDACASDVGITHTPDDTQCSVGQFCDVEAGCSFGDVRLLITKFSLQPTSEDTADGFGQWFSVANIGEIPVDLRDLEVSNGTEQNVGVVAFSKDPEEEVLLEPGQTRAGHKDAAPGQGPFNTAGFSFVFGEPGDGFKFAPDGGAIILRLGGVANDTLDASQVSKGPSLAGNAMPLIPGVPAELDVAALGQATDHTDNDIPSQWCAWAEGSAGPEGPQLECSRARLNEIALAGADGERFVEIHMPAGGSLNGFVVQMVDGDGAVQGTAAAPSIRTPIGGYGVILDGEGVDLPTLTDGACQLFRVSNLIDVYGFGTLAATEDSSYGKALVEGSPGPSQVAGESAARLQSGIDTDDNAADWGPQAEPTPGSDPAL